tara:strand:- start:444 stop:596 length:153 start_codon:yes stop_codon:yes gene_type:complete
MVFATQEWRDQMDRDIKKKKEELKKLEEKKQKKRKDFEKKLRKRSLLQKG